MNFFDTSCLVRLYLDENGFEAVRELAGAAPIASSWHAQAEMLSAFHRAYREGRLDDQGYQAQRDQFFHDRAASAFHWLPISAATWSCLERVQAKASRDTFLRAADALHLACAAEHGYREVYSNDRHFLATASHFGLTPRNILSGLHS